MKFGKLRKASKELTGDKPGQADFQRKNVRRIKLNMKKKDKKLDETLTPNGDKVRKLISGIRDGSYKPDKIKFDIPENDINKTTNKSSLFGPKIDGNVKSDKARAGSNIKADSPDETKAWRRRWRATQQRTDLGENAQQVFDAPMSEPSINMVDAVKAAIAGEPAAFQTAINTALQAKAVDAIGQYKQVVAQQIFNDQPPAEDYYADDEGPEDEDEFEDEEVSDDEDDEVEDDEDSEEERE